MEESLQKIIFDNSTIDSCVHWPLLRQSTKKISLSHLDGQSLFRFPWKKLRYLCILGNEDSREFPEHQDLDRPETGAWVDPKEEWLLIIRPSSGQIRNYLSNCTANLQKLKIRFTTLKSIDVGNLTGLEQLDLSDNRQLTQVEHINWLFRMQELDLGSTAIDSKLDLSNAFRLKQLDVSFSNIPGFVLNQPLPQLSTLYAAYTSIYSVDFLRYLPGLASLDITMNPITNADALMYCPELEILRAAGCNLTGIPSLHNHKRLLELYLYGNPITDLDNVVFPPNLTDLDLGTTALRQIPNGIRDLSSLAELGLSCLELDGLPDWLPEWVEQNEDLVIDLTNSTVGTLGASVFDQPWDLLRQWLIERKNIVEGSALNELKVVFLGDGGAGKSYTIARLLANGGQPESFDGSATPGIVITDKQYRIGDRDVLIHFWDFGGQEILHSMHRMFLTERTLYVVVLNVRDGTQNERARYWLHNIKSFAPNAPLLLVLNQMDENPNASINESDLGSITKYLTEIVKISALKDTAEKFNAAFTSALLRQIGQMSETLDFFFPAAWTKVKQSLHNMEAPYIDGDQYNDLCQKFGVKDEGNLRKDLLHWFNDLGVSFCYGDARLEDYVILRPNWLTNAIYILLYNKMDTVKNGIVPLDDVYRILKLKSRSGKAVRSVLPGVTYSQREVSYVLEVVRKFRLYFRLDDSRAFFPMLCDSNSLPIAAEYEQDPDTLEFRMEYDYLPNNVLHRLMVELRGHLDTRQVWLTGALFSQESTGLSAVVKSEGNDLRVFVRSTRPLYKANTYLCFIKDALDRINRSMGLKPPSNLVVYKANGIKDEFDYDDLLNAQEDGETTYRSRVLRKRIPIDDILKQAGPAPDRTRDDLRRDICLACAVMQSDKLYWNLPDSEKGTKEDHRNRYIRNLLRGKGYHVFDQTQSGTGAGGKRAGELDLEIRRAADAPWTIYEALNISGTKDMSNWDKHLHKLLINYNPNGLPFLFLVSYLECSRMDFPKIADAYDNHMRSHDPEGCERLPGSFSTLEENHGQFIRMSECTYYSGVHTTVYHICVRLGD